MRTPIEMQERIEYQEDKKDALIQGGPSKCKKELNTEVQKRLWDIFVQKHR